MPISIRNYDKKMVLVGPNSQYSPSRNVKKFTHLFQGKKQLGKHIIDTQTSVDEIDSVSNSDLKMSLQEDFPDHEYV